MVHIQREDSYFWWPDVGATTSGTGTASGSRSKYPHSWSSDRSGAALFTDEEADIRIKYLKRYYGINAKKVV